MGKIRVLKFGGTSVGTTAKIRAIADFLAQQPEKLVVVVSAMSQMTDELISLAAHVSERPSKRELDVLLATGEQQSAALLAMALEQIGCAAVSLTGVQLGIVTDGLHTKSRISSIASERIESHLAKGELVIATGFQGVNLNGDTTTLGRGGSDTSAVALAAKLGATCEIYTDVDGIYTIDPRKIPQANKLKTISYEEMMELALRGASVMETRAVELAMKYGVPVYVGKSISKIPGTWIEEGVDEMERKEVTGIGVDTDVMQVTVSGIDMTIETMAELFSAFEQQGINVDMISQNADKSLACTCPRSEEVEMLAAITTLRTAYPAAKVETCMSLNKISLVGIGMMSSPGIAAQVFRQLARMQISIEQVSTSDISISILINQEQLESTLMVLGEHFNLV